MAAFYTYIIINKKKETFSVLVVESLLYWDIQVWPGGKSARAEESSRHVCLCVCVVGNWNESTLWDFRVIFNATYYKCMRPPKTFPATVRGRESKKNRKKSSRWRILGGAPAASRTDANKPDLLNAGRALTFQRRPSAVTAAGAGQLDVGHFSRQYTGGIHFHLADTFYWPGDE